MAEKNATRTDSGRDDRTETTNTIETRSGVDSGTATVIATERPDGTDGAYPNELTIVGRGAPSSFEITVDGAIDRSEDADDATIVSGTTVEGTIETGTVGFRFAGELGDVTFVDRSISGRSPGAVPNVHVDYGAGE